MTTSKDYIKELMKKVDQLEKNNKHLIKTTADIINDLEKRVYYIEEKLFNWKKS